MIPPLLDIFGHLANKEPAHQVIEGTFVAPEDIDPVVADIIESLKMPDSIKEKEKLTLFITPEDNKKSWKKQKDKTASAFGVPKFNHYKTSSQIQDLNELDTFLINTPLQMGIPPEGWKNVLDVQIPKNIDLPEVDRMRYLYTNVRPAIQHG